MSSCEKQTDFDPHAGQRGHALWLVLIAVMLFAALAYVISRSDKMAADEEKLLMASAQVMQFPAAIRTAMARLAAADIAFEDMDFSELGTSHRSIFYSGGGGVAYQKPPYLVGSQNEWRFKTKSRDNTGWFIAGIGTDGADGKDIFAYITDVPVALCEELNRSIGLSPEPKIEAAAVNLAVPGDAAATAGYNAWTFSAHARERRSETPPAACVRNGMDGELVYYHVLAAQ
jgi:hypothetical protein